MAQNAKKIDWANMLRIIILVLSAIAEVIAEGEQEEKKEDSTKSVEKK